MTSAETSPSPPESTSREAKIAALMLSYGPAASQPPADPEEPAALPPDTPAP